MGKLITDELITQRMESKGWIEGCDDEHARNQVLAYYECKITDNMQRPEFSIYEESTRDGYSVWIATADPSSISICEDVYYYDSGVAEAIMEMVNYSNGHCTIYADQYLLDDIYFDDVLLEAFSDIAENIYNEIKNDKSDYGFDMAELQWLKEEFTESEEINQTVS